MKRTLCALVFLCAAATCFADGPKSILDGAVDIPQGGSILLDGRRSTSEKPLVWKLLAPHESDIFFTFDKDKRSDVILYMPNPKPGTYRFVLIASSLVLDKGLPIDIALDVDIKEVIVAIPTPPPNPTPVPPGPFPPGPTPDPAPQPPAPLPPVNGKMFISYIYDSIKPDQSPLSTSATFRAALSPLNAGFVAADRSAPVVKDLNLGGYADLVGLPAVLVQDATGKVILKFKVATEADAIAQLRRLRNQ